MDLERISVTLRPRRAFEAVDLGFALGRRWWHRSLGALTILALPVACMTVGLSMVNGWLGILLIWWLEPVLERVPLEMISRGFFGEEIGVRAALVRTRWPGPGELLAMLTWGRLSPVRSYYAPVSQLEGLRGGMRRERLRVLGRELYGAATLVTASALAMEVLVYLGVCALPLLLGADEPLLTPPTGELGLAVVAGNVVLLAILLGLMPFYVGAGFALYIKRRVDLEGWDLELAFRRLARRAEPREPERGVA